MSISPTRLMFAMSAAQQMRASLAGEHDETTILDAIDSETDALDLFDRLGESMLADQLLAARADERAQRLATRAARTKAVMAKMLEVFEVPKLERALFTASMVANPPKVIVTDTAAIPLSFLRSAPDLRLIGSALKSGEEVPGATLSNQPASMRMTSR